jgi:hypothetical protein
MHENPILMHAAPPAGHRARLLLQTALFLLVPLVLIVVALTVLAALVL